MDIAFIQALIAASEKNLQQFCVLKKKGTTTLFYDNKNKVSSLNDVQSDFVTGFIDYEGKPYWYEWHNAENFEDFDIEKESKLDIEISDNWNSSLSESQYVELVEKMKDNMRQGKYYLANLTRMLEKENSDPIYSAIYSCIVHKTPNRFFIKDDDLTLLGLSPERFIKIQNNQITTEPMKGTGTSVVSLSSNAKELEENIMMTDLARSDLSQVCLPGSITVVEQNKFSEHPGIIQMSSVIRGELLPDLALQKIVDTIMPISSVTGTPKPYVVEEIKKLEPHQRDLYCGVYGWADVKNKECDLSVTIRSIFTRDNMSYIGVGSGITLQSDAKKEWDETELKANRLQKIVDAQEISVKDRVFTSFSYKNNAIFAPYLHIERLVNHANGALDAGLELQDVMKQFVSWLSGVETKENHFIRPNINMEGGTKFEYLPYENNSDDVVLGISPFPKTHTATSYKWDHRNIYINALQIGELLAGEPIDESLLLVDGHITEASRANVFLRKENRVITPPLTKRNLSGVVRSILVEKLRAENVFVLIEENICITDLFDADEIIVTNSVRGPRKVKRICSYLIDKPIEFDDSIELFLYAKDCFDRGFVKLTDLVSE